MKGAQQRFKWGVSREQVGGMSTGAANLGRVDDSLCGGMGLGQRRKWTATDPALGKRWGAMAAEGAGENGSCAVPSGGGTEIQAQ